MRNRPVVPPGASPPWFAQEWRHCALRAVHAGRADLRAGKRFARSQHDQWVLYGVKSGRIEAATSGGTHTARVGQSWLVPPDRPVGDAVPVGGAVVWVALFDVLPAAGWRNPLERLDLPRVVDDCDAAAWTALLEGFVDWAPRDLDALLRARAPLERLVTGHLLAGFAGGAFSGRAQAAPLWVEDLAFWLCSNALRRDIDLRAVVAHAGYSTSHVIHEFSRCYGVGPLGFLRQERMRLAARLLREKRDEAVAAIAARLGYADAALFSRHFRAMHGASPRAWRRSGGAP